MSYRVKWCAYLHLKRYLWTLYLIHAHADFRIGPVRLKRSRRHSPHPAAVSLSGVGTNPPLAAHLGVWGEAEGWSRTRQRRKESPRANSTEPNRWSDADMINPIIMTRSAVVIVPYHFKTYIMSPIPNSPFLEHLFLSHSMIVELFWWLCWYVICCSFIDFNN